VNLTREQLLAGGRRRTRTVTFADGGTVLVRGLTRAEALSVSNARDDVAEVEALMCAYGLAEPALTLEDARQLLTEVEAGDVQRICEAIQELSGMDEGAAKRATKSAARRPRPDVRTPPRGEAGSDGG
jgi:hypothetical protein